MVVIELQPSFEPLLARSLATAAADDDVRKLFETAAVVSTLYLELPRPSYQDRYSCYRVRRQTNTSTQTQTQSQQTHTLS